MADSLATLVTTLYRRVRLGIRVATSARVVTWDADTCSVSALPSVDEQDLQDGEARTIEAVTAHKVPVIQPGGALRGRTYGLSADDGLVLLMRHRSHDEVDGGTEALPVSPESNRRMSYADAVGLPGYVPPQTGRPAAHYRSDGQLVDYMPSGESLHVGASTAAFALARADLVEAQLTALLSAIQAAPVVGGDGGASFKAAIIAALSSWPAPVATTRLKVDS